MNLHEHAHEYDTRGLTVIPAVVSQLTAWDWARRALSTITDDARLDRKGGNVTGDLDEGGDRAHGILDTYAVQRVLPELMGWYQAARPLIETVVDREVILSPYERSQVTVKVYHRPGDEHGWHRDTNPLTALLILTDTHGDYGTEIEERDGSTLHLRNNAGDLLLMQGRELRHRVPPLPQGYWRVTVPLNYYFPDDVWRPDGTDELVYGRA